MPQVTRQCVEAVGGLAAAEGGGGGGGRGLRFVGEVLARLCRRGQAAAVAEALWRGVWHCAAVEGGAVEGAEGSGGERAQGEQSVRSALCSVDDPAALGALLPELMRAAGRGAGGDDAAVAAAGALARLLQGRLWARSDVRWVAWRALPHMGFPSTPYKPRRLLTCRRVITSE